MKDSRTLPPLQTSLDRNQLNQVRKNYLALSAHRLHLAQESLPKNQNLYLDLLPALLHFNHPMLPGYCDRKTPAGVYQYHASEQTQKRLQRLAKSFHPNRNKNQRPDILSIFTMGSLGSLAQNHKSDIDVWLCYRTDLNTNELALLSKKAEKITEWANSFGIDTTIFLMNHRHFHQGSNQALDKESSGNMQHLLLLDEFYRTAIFISGQLPIWLFTTNTTTEHYSIETQKLLDEKRLPDKKMIDFGPVDNIPYGEFISAAIWQLYKAIESPYKAIIKLLLIEIYATKNKTTDFLSNQFKQWLQSDNFDESLSLNDYDPYYKTYQFIEDYLIDSQQKNRLELIRRCFYFKVAHPEIRKNNSSIEAKKKFIHHITQNWGWDEHFVNQLNQRHLWKTDAVGKERNTIIDALSKSYHFIIDFFKKEKFALSASNKELNILGRKLHAAFSKKTGKIDWLNPSISSDISESHIKITKKSHNIWVAKNINSDPIDKKASFIELIISLHCNQIINKKTIIETDKKLKIPTEKALEKIKENIATPLKPANHSCFEKKHFTKKVIVFFHSFEKPDYFLVPDQPQQQAYYLQQNCTLDIVTINSWNEITCQKIQGVAESIIPTAFSKFLVEPAAFSYFHACFFDANIAQALRPYTNQLKQSLTDFFSAHYYGRFFIKNNQGYSSLSHTPTESSFFHYPSTDELYQALSQHQNSFCALGADIATLSNTKLAIFAKYNQADCIQIFFEIKQTIADIIIVDEQGTFYLFSIRYKTPQESLLPIYTYCRSVNERRLNSNAAELSPLDILPISIYELRLRNTRWHAEQIYLNNQAAPKQQFTIHGLAQYKQNDFIFTLYCDEQCFSEVDEQATAFKKMALWMHLQSKKRHQVLDYIIADLDISRCQQAFTPAQTLHTAHYLLVKAALEQKLENALLAVTS